MPRQETDFEIDATYEADAFVIRIKGELDMVGSPTLAFALAEAERSKAERILLDLEELTFIDGRGLSAIVGASRHSARNGHRMQITRGRGQVARLFRLTGFDQWLPFSDAVAGSPEPQASD